jgi:hydrogenase maturation protease
MAAHALDRAAVDSARAAVHADQRADATVVVIGVGSELRGDDAVGLEVARAVRVCAPAGWRVVESTGECGGLLDLWQGADLAIVVDAATVPTAPGTVFRLDGLRDPLPASGAAHSTHGAGLPEAIALGKKLGRLPRRLTVYAVVGGSFEFGGGLTLAVQQAVGAVVTEILRRGAGP